MREVCVLSSCRNKRQCESISAFINEACVGTFIPQMLPEKLLPDDSALGYVLQNKKKKRAFNSQGILSMSETRKRKRAKSRIKDGSRDKLVSLRPFSATSPPSALQFPFVKSAPQMCAGLIYSIKGPPSHSRNPQRVSYYDLGIVRDVRVTEMKQKQKQKPLHSLKSSVQ